MITIPAVVPPLPTQNRWRRSLTPADAFTWLASAWRDLATQPVTSLSYGLLIFLASVAIVAGLFRLGWDSVLFPAFAGFMLVGPLLAIGL